MSHRLLASLELDELTPRQLRQILRGVARSQLPYGRKTDEEKEEDKSEASEENESLVNLHREKSGDPKAPKVLKDDLPADDESEDSEEKPVAKKKKGGA